MVEKEEAKAKLGIVESTEVASQFSQAFKLPNGEIVDSTGLLIWLCNQVLDIKRAVA